MLRHIKSTVFLSVLVLMFATVSGCANYGQGVSQDALEDDKSFTTLTDKSIIYIYRPGSNIKDEMPVNLNGKFIAMTGAKSYLMLPVDPGEHEISSEEGNFSSITIKTQAGKNYFILQEVVKSFTSTGANLQEVSGPEGRRGVRECKLVG